MDINNLSEKQIKEICYDLRSGRNAELLPYIQIPKCNFEEENNG